MARPKSDAPSASWSKAWRQYVIRLSGEDIPLGPACGVVLEANRTRALAEWYSRGKQPRHRTASPITIGELILARFEHIEAVYSNSDRDVYHESRTMKLAFQPLLLAHGRESAADFTVEKLERLRDAYARHTVKRRGRVVNVTKTWVDKQVSYVRRLFKWATRRRLISASVHAELSTMEPLRGSETVARVNRPVEPVDEAIVIATLRFLPPTTRAMVELQHATGMRSGEICQMTQAMIDTTATPWRYVPKRRKTDRHNWNPPVFLSTQCQSILTPLLHDLAPDDPIFSPQQAQAERNAAKRLARKSTVQPSQVNRSRGSGTSMRRAYTTSAYYRAVAYAVAAAIKNGALPAEIRWNPHQLRHAAARAFAQQESLAAAQALLGHKKIETTIRYVGHDEKYAADLAERFVSRSLKAATTGFPTGT